MRHETDTAAAGRVLGSVASKLGRVALLATLVALLLSATAGATDSIYWGNENDPVRVGNLDGSGTASTVFAGATPCGVAINPAAGKIYWASWTNNAIQVGNLDGSGTASTLIGESGNLCGVAIDPAAGKIYWANFSTDSIRVGNLDGSGTASTLFTEPGGSAPSGLAIDPAAGKIYWTNQFTDQVRVGNLDGSGTASTLFGGVDDNNPIGVAIDPAAGKIYWTDLGNCCSGPGKVRVGNLDGSGTASTLFDNEGGPGGLAIDPAANKVYWATFGPGVIRVGNLDGSGTASTLFSGESSSLFAALLKTPAGAGPPVLSSGVGGELACSQGSWAPDLLGGFLYRAPQSFAYQWLLDGNPISGADQSTFTPGGPGDYTCQVTASNHAGSASQTSDPFTVPATGTLQVAKFYDANANGINDDGQSINGWKVRIQDGIDSIEFTPVSLTVAPDDYTVTEFDPVETNWFHTTSNPVHVTVNSGDDKTVEFGNVCVGAGGGKTIGFWSNKNGRALFGNDDLATMVSLNLRKKDGSAFDPASYAQFKSWLGNADAVNMAYMLSAQLAATKLNLLNGLVSSSAIVYAPGTQSANALGFANITDLVNEANAELGAHGLTKAGSAYRSYQRVLKNALEKANNNRSFVQSTECNFSFGS